MNFTYIIIDRSDLGLVDLQELLLFCAEPCRVSHDGTKVYVKYVGGMPKSLIKIPSRSVEYPFEQIADLLAAENWSSRIQF